MNITEFVSINASASVKSDIAERWESRIVAEGLHLQGSAGAEYYLSRYGKGLKAPKAIGFARCAEIKGFPMLANRFWEEAFFLETGERASMGAAAKPVSCGFVASPAIKEPFGYRPQLLVAITRAQALRWVVDPTIGVQEKVDGERVMCEVRGDTVRAGNKKGLLRSLPLNVVKALLGFGRSLLVDGELVGNRYYIFDLLFLDGVDVRPRGFYERWAMLEEAFYTAGYSPAYDGVELVPLVTSEIEKLSLIARLEAEGKEGFVLKKLSAPYVEGESHGDQWKFQFRIVNSVIVGQRNGSKSSVMVFVLRADGTRRRMGSVTIPQNYPIPTEGEIAEVENLYTYPGVDGEFAQAVFKGVRTDAEAADCQEAKLRVKGVAVE